MTAEPASADPASGSFLPQVLGERTAEMHLALGRSTDDGAFAPERMEAAVIASELAGVRASAERAFAALEKLGAKAGAASQDLLSRRSECLAAIEATAVNWDGLTRTRIHGDFHLGQVLLNGNNVVFVDFEGEPARSPAERRAKASPLQDVAGMLRSFAYAGEVAARDVISRLALDQSGVTERARDWSRRAAVQFLESYMKRIETAAPDALAANTSREHLRFQLFKKAFYEVEYEANNRPDWVGIPVDGILDLLSGRGGSV